MPHLLAQSFYARHHGGDEMKRDAVGADEKENYHALMRDMKPMASMQILTHT